MECMLLMHRDETIARIADGQLESDWTDRLPLCLKRTGNVTQWLSMRAIDEHRTNSRLLKKALRLAAKDDVSTALHFNAVTITDNYWIKKADSTLAWDDVRFSENHFDTLALRGDVNAFGQPPSRTPELTNTGSYEKCWRLIDGRWWMYKAGTPVEHFTELFAYELASALNIPVAQYEMDGRYIRTADFTYGAAVDFETAFAIIGDDSDYASMYDKLVFADERLGASFVSMTYFDALIFNMDRHEHNFGILRDVDTGAIIGMAPLYDHNIALISRGYPKNVTRQHDRLIEDFVELIRARHINFDIPELTPSMVREALRDVHIPLPPSASGGAPKEFVENFVLNGQQEIMKRLAAL